MNLIHKINVNLDPGLRRGDVKGVAFTLCRSGEGRNPEFYQKVAFSILSLLLLICPCKAYEPTDVPNFLTMERAVQLACQHRADIKALKQLEQAYRMQARATWGGYLPTADLAAGVAKWRSQRWPTVNTSLTVKQPVYNPSLAHDYKAAQCDTERQKMVTQEALLEMRHVVEVEFLKGWQLQQQEESIQTLCASAEATFKEAKHKNKLRLLDSIDWLKSTSDHASSVATFHNYSDDLIIEQRKLEFLLGNSIKLCQLTGEKKLNLSWESDRDIELNDVNWYIRHAMKSHPALKEIRKRIETEQHRARSLQKMALPTINLVAGAGIQSEDVHEDETNFYKDGAPFYNVGVSVGLNVFDGLTNRYKERGQQARILHERLNYDHKFNEIVANVESAFYTLSKSITTLHAEKAELKRARNEYERRKKEFDAGMLSRAEYKTAKTLWEKARFQWTEARVDAAIKERDLLYACGYPSGELTKEKTTSEEA